MHLTTRKLFSLEQAVEERRRLRVQGRSLVMTNGCFDLLHPGHVYFLNQAKAQGDALWILVNSAQSVGALKGPKRPILGDEQRAYMLGALECVDGILFFGTPRLDREIGLLQPDVYVKASDYTLEKLDLGERGALEGCGAQIRFLEFLPGFSTTALIEKICKASSHGA